MRNLARFTFCYDQICAGHGSPGDIRCACASPAIDAMTIAQVKWPTFQSVSCPSANASASDFHGIHSIRINKSGNHESRKGISEIEGKAAGIAASEWSRGAAREIDGKTEGLCHAPVNI